MANHPHSSTPPQVPPEMLAERKAGWRAFTILTLIHCVGLAAFLLLMLLVYKLVS